MKTRLHCELKITFENSENVRHHLLQLTIVRSCNDETPKLHYCLLRVFNLSTAVVSLLRKWLLEVCKPVDIGPLLTTMRRGT
jgi:hypothetical protein